MKASELMLGNYIQYLSGDIFQVSAVDFEIIEQVADYLKPKPIPLNEEWLIKFGWIWNEECKSYEKYPNGDARMNLQWRDLSGSYTMFNYVLKALIAERIYYVHQLQNLFYALTGEELTINQK